MTEEKKLCANCLYFKKHYVISRGNFKELTYGHCVKNVPKHRNEDDAACKHWKPQTDIKKENMEFIGEKLMVMAKQVKLFAEYFENTFK